MKIKDIQIDGFGVWSGLSVDSLPDTMTLFYGKNEAGKTTLMQFIRTMFYGFTDARRDKYLPPVNGGTPGGVMRVTGPGGGYEIKRHSLLSDVGVTGELTVTTGDGLVQGAHRLASLLGGIDEAIFTNVFAIGMRELQELATLDDTSAADELYKLSSGLDRVSLVDVLRNLRSARHQLVADPAAGTRSRTGQLETLVTQREKLQNEIADLTRGGRRWSDLATQRRAGLEEIERLGSRIEAWQKEVRTVEVAGGVFENWRKRESIDNEIARIESEVHLPEDAPGQLVQIDAAMAEKRQTLEEIKDRRRMIREKAAQIPVSRRMLDLQSRIEAAGEQATWVEALEDQIERLDGQIEKATKQLDADAESMGLDEDERLELIDGDARKLPDLSRQTLAALAEPSKAVKEQMFLLKQARDEAITYKNRCEGLREKINDVLSRAHATDLQDAIRQQTELSGTIKHRIRLGDNLDKLKSHYKKLERESVELTTDEAFPIDRVLMLGIPFVLGSLTGVYGFSHIFGIRWLISRADPMWGTFLLMLSAACLAVYVLAREMGRRGTSLERDDCERQIDSLRRQIRELESERDGAEIELPSTHESLDVRLRDAERLTAELEASLPTYHNMRAADEAHRNAKQRATTATDALRAAKDRWTSTLGSLGLSESLSPSSVRKLAEGYEAVQSSRRRLDDLVTERNERRRERSNIAKRIEALYLEMAEVQAEAAGASGDSDESSDFEPESRYDRERGESIRRRGPLEQLNHLNEELSRQQHWIKRRRELKQQDANYKRQYVSVRGAIERHEQQRRALWAKCGVATQEQFHQMVDLKSQLRALCEQRDDLEKHINSAIGTGVDRDDVGEAIRDASIDDIQRREESLATRLIETEARIATLRTSTGELTSEMKHLADDDRLDVARLELGVVERKIARLSRRWQTLAGTTVLVEDVCQTFESERQPETLREASSFLRQLTDGKYVRIWTPLGRNALRIDAADGSQLPLEVLSRGTREAVFIALRLSLASAYARRGVMLPLVLDDVLVNFDGDRAIHAARTLKTFAELGHQVMMFTCHEHIVRIFQAIDVQVRQMPPQGTPGRAFILEPETHEPPEMEYDEVEVDAGDEVEEPEFEVVEQIIEPEIGEPEPVIEPELVEPVMIVPEVIPPQVVEPVVIEMEPEPTPPPAPRRRRMFIEPSPSRRPEPVKRAPAKREPVRTVVEPEPKVDDTVYEEFYEEYVRPAWYQTDASDNDERSNDDRSNDDRSIDEERLVPSMSDEDAWWAK